VLIAGSSSVTLRSSMMLSALCLAVLLLTAGVQRADAAVPAACVKTPTCNLPQCPCYAKQIDNENYTRPAGCVATVRWFSTSSHAPHVPCCGITRLDCRPSSSAATQPADTSKRVDLAARTGAAARCTRPDEPLIRA